MHSDLVSIILCVYGYQNYISKTINSLINQTYKNVEIIIIDDACIYDLKKEIYRINDKRIIYLKNETNIGFTKSLIKGINNSKGGFIAIHDAGNIAYANRIELQLDFLKKFNEYFLIGTSVEIVDENGQEIYKKIACASTKFIQKTLPKFNCINHSSIFFKNDKSFSYREKFKYAQDYDFYLNLLTQKKILGNIPEILVQERFIDDSITFSKREEQAFYAELARKFYFERLNYGKDTYDSFIFIDNNKEKNLFKDNLFFKKQKAYYLLYSLKFKTCRLYIKEIKNNNIDLKLKVYYLLSFFPFFIKFLKKVKKINLV